MREAPIPGHLARPSATTCQGSSEPPSCSVDRVVPTSQRRPLPRRWGPTSAAVSPMPLKVLRRHESGIGQSLRNRGSTQHTARCNARVKGYTGPPNKNGNSIKERIPSNARTLYRAVKTSEASCTRIKSLGNTYWRRGESYRGRSCPYKLPNEHAIAVVCAPRAVSRSKTQDGLVYQGNAAVQSSIRMAHVACSPRHRRCANLRCHLWRTSECLT